jgi:excisionase family DNA binding protein
MNADLKHLVRSADHDTERNPEPAQAMLAGMPGSSALDAQASGNGPAAVAHGHLVSTTDDVIDVQAVARLLHVGRNTVYALVARNAIPHRRLGKQIRFNQAAVMRWLDSWSSQDAKERQ